MTEIHIWPLVRDALYAVWRVVTNSELANISSLLGLGISFYVLRSVQDLRKRVLLKSRAGDVIKELRERASVISSATHDLQASLPAIDEQIAMAQETLKNVREKTGGETRRTVKLCIKGIRRYNRLRSEDRSTHVVLGVYTLLLTAAKAIELTIEDYSKEP